MSARSPASSWSTSAAPRRAQFAHWREVICEAFLDLTPESDLREGFAGGVDQWPLGELSIARITSQRQRVARTARDIARSGRGGYYANLQVRGTGVMAQDDRSTVLRPGDLAIVDTGRPFAFSFRDDFQQLSLFLPAALFDAQLAGPAATATRVATTSGIGAAVRHSMLALIREPLRDETADRLAVHSAGLLALAVARSGAPDGGRTGQSGLYAEALADIDEHLGDHDLSPPVTAHRLGVSVRLLHGSFAGRERSYAAEVRRRRLEVARRDLEDPAQRQLRVIDIAVTAGFASVATFHRAFRREFQRTPASLRSPEWTEPAAMQSTMAGYAAVAYPAQ